jgi:hypothetical protein
MSRPWGLIELVRSQPTPGESGVTTCPLDDGSGYLVRSAYSAGRTLDLWFASTGCQQIDTGLQATLWAADRSGALAMLDRPVAAPSP